MITAIIWDAGGTLFDTYPAVVSACRSAMASFGAAASAEWLMGLFRQTTAVALRVVAATYAIDLGLLTERFRAAYDASPAALQLPFPYAREVCTHMVGLGGSNFVVTHRGRVSLARLLAAHCMGDFFRDYMTADDPYPRKPDPASILALLLRYRLDPPCCLIVGDRDLDLVAGTRAGVTTCFFGSERHDERADVEVADLGQLLRWLEQHEGEERL
jgi:phosphoglycolate phosphatase-like HAD superfamily hydrolase